MIDKNALLSHVENLIELAKARGTEQGVKVYEVVLVKIKESSTQAELNQWLVKLKHALHGIEAHGYFTNAEFKVVKAIQDIG